MSIPKLKDLLEMDIRLSKKERKIGGIAIVSEGEVMMVRRAENAGKYPNYCLCISPD